MRMAETVGFFLAVTLGTTLGIVGIAYLGMAIEWLWNWWEDRYG